MPKPSNNLTLIPGEIVKISKHVALSEEDDSSDSPFYAYILDSVKKGKQTVSYAVLPVHIIPNDETGHQKELELLRDHRGKISTRLEVASHSEKIYRVQFEVLEIPADSELKITPIERIQSISTQKNIEQALVKSVVRQNFSIVDGSPMFVGALAESRTMKKTNDAPYYIDINVHQAAAAGYIPQEVADILTKFGKIARLGTAAEIAKDKNADKLLQIYDKARPTQSMPFDVFKNYITTGYSYFNTEILNNAEAAQAKIPASTCLEYPKKEKITFKFVERQPDLSIDDAYHAHSFIWNEETYKIIKAAGFKTLRHAFDTVQEHGVSALRQAFKKVNPHDFTLREIAADIREAQEAFDKIMESPDNYAPFDWSTQLNYPIREVK